MLWGVCGLTLHCTLRLLLGRMAIPSFHSRTWTMLQAPPTCAVRVGVVVSLILPPLPGSPMATAGVTSIFWWPGAGAEDRGAINSLPRHNLLQHHVFLVLYQLFFFVLLTIHLKRKSSFTVWYKKKKNRVTWYFLLHCHPPTCAHLAGGKLWWWWWWCGAVDEPSWPHRHSHRWGRPRRGTRTMGPQVCDQVLWVEPPCSLWHSSRCVPVPYSGALRGKEYEETIKY